MSVLWGCCAEVVALTCIIVRRTRRPQIRAILFVYISHVEFVLNIVINAHHIDNLCVSQCLITESKTVWNSTSRNWRVVTREISGSVCNIMSTLLIS